MFVFASADSVLLDAWRPAFDEGTAIVEVRSTDALVRCVGSLRPNVILLDTRIAHQGAARVVAQVMQVHHTAQVLAFGDEHREDQELALFMAGARGYCSFSATPELMRRAVEAVRLGELWIRRALVPRLVGMLTANIDEATTGATGRFAILTPREIEVARLVGQGASNKVIARQLSITERTVKSHLTTIFRKTDTDDRVKLALLAAHRH